MTAFEKRCAGMGFTTKLPREIQDLLRSADLSNRRLKAVLDLYEEASDLDRDQLAGIVERVNLAGSDVAELKILIGEREALGLSVDETTAQLAQAEAAEARRDAQDPSHYDWKALAAEQVQRAAEMREAERAEIDDQSDEGEDDARVRSAMERLSALLSDDPDFRLLSRVDDGQGDGLGLGWIDAAVDEALSRSQRVGSGVDVARLMSETRDLRRFVTSDPFCRQLHEEGRLVEVVREIDEMWGEDDDGG